MLKTLRVQNYESHKDSLLNFHPGINTVIGDSDKGKSGIFRSIMAVTSNKMMELSHISKWIKGKDGSGKILSGEECRIELGMDNGTVTRIRSDKQNSYLVTGLDDSLDAVKKDVPEQVAKLVNMDDVNYQWQFDPPYFLGISAGQVAKELNKIVKIDVIDKYISVSKKKVRETETKIANEQAEIDKQDIGIEKLIWVESAKPHVEVLKETMASIDAITAKLALLEKLLNQHSESIAIVEKYKPVLEAEKWVLGAKRDAADAIIAKTKIMALDKDIDLLSRASRFKVFNHQPVMNAIALLKEIEMDNVTANMIRASISTITSIIANHSDAQVVLQHKEGILEAGDALSSIKQMDDRIVDLRDSIIKIGKSISSLNSADTVLANRGEIERVSAIIDFVNTTSERISHKKSDIFDLGRLINYYNSNIKDVAVLGEEIRMLQASMPECCVTCGQPIKGKTHEH